MNSSRLWSTFQTLTDIYSPSLGERDFCDALKTHLAALGIPHEEDAAGEKIGGSCGNLYARMPASGGVTLPPLLFSAHMDTVEPAKGKRAVLREDGTITSSGGTILGADDVAGITILLEAAARLREESLPHRGVEFLFSAAEELYSPGAAAADYSRIEAKEAYVLDLTGAMGEAANAAPTILSFTVTVQGKAAHAGFEPEKGVNAIAVATAALARLPQGRPEPDLLFNIGTISGGEMTNIVPALCTITGEIRSLSHSRALAQWGRVQSAFQGEAVAAGAMVEMRHTVHIAAYETPLDSPVVRRYQNACQAVGVQCRIRPTYGGSDNNVFAQRGIAGLVIACSMHNVHSTGEWCRLDEMEQGVRLVMRLIAG